MDDLSAPPPSYDKVSTEPTHYPDVQPPEIFIVSEQFPSPTAPEFPPSDDAQPTDEPLPLDDVPNISSPSSSPSSSLSRQPSQEHQQPQVVTVTSIINGGQFVPLPRLFVPCVDFGVFVRSHDGRWTSFRNRPCTPWYEITNSDPELWH